MGTGDWFGNPRLRVRVAFVAVLLAAAVSGLGVSGALGAGARHRGGTSAAAQVQSALALAGRIPKSKFARGRRGPLLSSARRARRLAHSKKTCRTLAAADAVLNSLADPTTWRKGRRPGSARRPLSLLASAEKTLMRRAGSRCAKPAATRRLVPHRGGSGSPKVQPPSGSPEQGEGVNKPIPLGRLILPKSIGGGSPLGADMHSQARRAAGDVSAHIASGPFSFFRNSDVGVAPFSGSPREPTAAIAPGAGVGWYTGNSWDALSTDNGRSWTRLDPSSVLPDQGLAFCCDQIVSYSPTYNIFVWVSQYWCNSSCLATDQNGHNVCRNDGTVYNRIRIAVATPEDLRANASNPGAAWTYWDVTPQTVGEPLNAWFDRSDMSVNPWNFNWGVDVLCGDNRGGNLLSRISLAQLAARGTVTLSSVIDNGVRTTAQGAGTTTTYFTGANSLSQARIWSWAPFSGTLFRHDINHTSVPIFDNAIKGTNGGNWYDRYGIFPGEVESATYSGTTLYLAQGTGRAYCTANCSSNSPTLNHVLNEPAILITKFDTNTWADVGERWIWNSSLAFGWPALQTDGAGDVGLAFRASSENQNAQPVAGFLSPSEQFFWADPAGMAYETGDYYSLRPGRTSQSFVMTGETMQNDSGAPNMHWFYIEYGLGTPPYVAPPNVHITSPANLSQFNQGATVGYSAEVSDPIDGTLPSAAIVWTEDGTQIGTGSSLSHQENSPGTHLIKVTATNGDGKSASDQITIRVLPPPGPIQAQITSPKDGSSFSSNSINSTYNQYCSDIPFQSTSSGGSGTLSYSWNDQVTYGQTVIAADHQVATGQNPTITLCAGSNTNTTYTHNITLTVTDGKTSTQAFVTVYVSGLYIN